VFIPVTLGCLIGLCLTPMVNRDYFKQRAKYKGMPPAELRLKGMFNGRWAIPIGLFITAWTSYPHLHRAGPAMGGLLVVLGFVMIYISANNYIVDSYQHWSASALAAKRWCVHCMVLALYCSWCRSMVSVTSGQGSPVGFLTLSYTLPLLQIWCHDREEIEVRI
jgi:hypothetical protein